MPDKTELAESFQKDYWRFYLSLEEQLIATFDYVEPSQEHFKTYSRKYLGLLQALGSEVDVCGKSLVELLNPDEKDLDNCNIAKWGFFIQSGYPLITANTVHAPIYGLSLTPWKNWKNESYRDKNNALKYRLTKGSTNPAWWVSYNKTKHRRKSLLNPDDSCYNRANLGNVLNAAAGLFLLELALANTLDLPKPEDSELFQVDMLVLS